MYSSRAQGTKSLPETNSCLSGTKKDVNIETSLSITLSRSLLLLLVLFCLFFLGGVCVCIIVFLTSHPPRSGQPLPSHISFSFVSSAGLPSTQLSPEEEDGREDDPCLTLWMWLIAKGNKDRNTSQPSLCILPEQQDGLREWPSWGRKRLRFFFLFHTAPSASDLKKTQPKLWYNSEIAAEKRTEDARVSCHRILTARGRQPLLGSLGSCCHKPWSQSPSSPPCTPTPDGTSGNDNRNWRSGYLSGINNAVDEGNFQMSWDKYVVFYSDLRSYFTQSPSSVNRFWCLLLRALSSQRKNHPKQMSRAEGLRSPHPHVLPSSLRGWGNAWPCPMTNASGMLVGQAGTGRTALQPAPKGTALLTL